MTGRQDWTVAERYGGDLYLDQVVTVTGAAGGVGRTIASWFVEHGATVVAVDREAESLTGVVEALSHGGGKVRAVVTDITDMSSVQELADSVRETEGRCDVLVNNAGYEDIRRFIETDKSFWTMITSINLLGPISVTSAFLPLMIEAGNGAIVNISSDAGRVGSSGETVYAAAKGGVISFTKSLAREMARHQIVVNCVCPGPIDTPAFDRVPEKLQAALVRSIPLRRIATPHDIAHTVGFFASPMSRYITGQVISVNGGLTMMG